MAPAYGPLFAVDDLEQIETDVLAINAETDDQLPGGQVETLAHQSIESRSTQRSLTTSRPSSPPERPHRHNSNVRNGACHPLLALDPTLRR